MNLNQLKSTYWTNQQTGKHIGPLYSWNDIREMQMNEDMSKMRDISKKENLKGSSRTVPIVYE